MAYAHLSQKEAIDITLTRLINQIEESIRNGMKLPWQEPFFVGYMRKLVNVERKQDFNGNPCPNGCPYTGLVNPLFLFYGAIQAQNRHGLTTFDHRFVRKSSIVNSNWNYKIHRNAILKGLENRVEKEEYIDIVESRAIPVFFPNKKTIPNPNFKHNLPVSKFNKETVEVFTGEFSIGYVYNVADTNLIELGCLPKIEHGETKANTNIIDLESVVCGYPQMWKATDCIPHYSPITKEIHTPSMNKAVDSAAYYSTRAHELCHQIQDMLGLIKTKKDMEGYAFNELVAEMCASFVMGSLGFSSEESEKNSATYIQGWLERIKEDPKILLEAAQSAQKIGNLILNRRLPANIVKEESFTFLNEAVA